MVGEGVVNAAAVDIQMLAAVFHADGGTFDVPAGIAGAPGRFPFQRLILELGFREPEDKVVLVALIAVFLDAFADADSEIVRVVVVEDVVPLQLGRVKIDVSAGAVGVSLFEQGFDQMNVFRDAVGRRFHDVRAFDVEFFAVGKERIGVILRDFHDGLVFPAGALEHFVFAGVRVGRQMADVRDVHDALDVIPQIAEKFLQHIFHDVGAEVADVCKVVDGRPAGIHGDLTGDGRMKRLAAVRQGVIKDEIRHIESFLRYFLRFFSERLLVQYSMPDQTVTAVTAQQRMLETRR